MEAMLKIAILIATWFIAVLIAALAVPWILLWPRQPSDLSWKQGISLRYRLIYDLE